ncbi:MAG: cysteine desulfurase family protein, partial [Patescibacteria group bacterium]
EANNLAVFGLGLGMGDHVLTLVTEHASILEPCRTLVARGVAVTYLPVKSDGLIDLAMLKQSLRSNTALVSISYVNNEIGVIQPLREIAKIIRRFRKERSSSRPYLHLDACQAPRFLPLDVRRLGADLLTLNSAKIYGPKGVGALWRRRALKLMPLVYGGGQEWGERSGTENVPGLAGFAIALEQCVKLRRKESARLGRLRDYFIKRLLALPDTRLNGSSGARAPNNVNVTFVKTDSELVVLNLDARGVACSSGSACSARTTGASYVIEALGYEATTARGAVRFTLGRETTKADLDYVLRLLPSILSRARFGV